MNDRDQRRYDRLTRVQTFGRENTEAIGQILALAATDVQVLDAIMHNRYARQPAKLKAWLSASRVERAPQREKKTAPVNGAGPAPKP